MCNSLTRPRVSLLIISYNQEAFISEAIASAIDQDYGNLEIIVSDDGSCDRTPQLIMEWASHHPGKIIPLLNSKNSGISKNLNIGLARCDGAFVSFVGGDDVLLPTKVSKQVEWFLDHSDAVLCGHRVDVLVDGVVTTPASAYTNYGRGSGPAQFISLGMQLHGASLMVRASVIPTFGFDETIPMVSDLMFCIDVLSGGGTYGFVDKALVNYRIHSKNISTHQVDKLLSDYEQTFHQAGRRYPQFKRQCESAITRHVHYFGGVKKLASGNARDAKAYFKKAITRDPLFIKAWVRLIQAFWRDAF